VTGKWRKLHSEELHNLYSSPDIIRHIISRRMRWAGYVACMGEEWKVYKVLVGKHEGKRPLGRPWHRWGMGSKWILGRMDGGIKYIQLAQERDRWQALVNTVKNLGFLLHVVSSLVS
jgi:hypothetical protein